MGYSLHAGQVIVADGTEKAARRIERTLTSDPAMGLFRHVDAGYDKAMEIARARGVKIPGLSRLKSLKKTKKTEKDRSFLNGFYFFASMALGLE